MKTSFFVAFTILLTSFFMESYSYIRFKFSGLEELKVHVSLLEKKLENEKTRSILAEFQLQDYRQNVATLLPEALQQKLPNEVKYPLRSLASETTEDDPDFLKIERAIPLFERARKAFREKRFEESAPLLQELISNYPYNSQIIDAHFLLVESLFQLQEFEPCIDTVEAMTTQFPESDLTGFAMLRLGLVFEKQDRLDDAAEMYRAVIRTYTAPQLQSQAKASLRNVSL